MIPRSFVLFAAVFSVSSSDDVVLVEGHQPHRTSRAYRSQRRHDDLNAHYRDSAQDVIYAPLDGERVITKGIYYVNGKSPDEDKIYSSILENRLEHVDGVDPFFVTPPPTRTTVAVKYSVVDSPPPSRSSDDNGVPVAVEETKSTARTKAPLRLVTFPPSSTTSLPPFKHRRPPNTRQTPEKTVSTSAVVSNDREFPPAPWHMPPLIPIPQGMLNPFQYPLQNQYASPVQNPLQNPLMNPLIPPQNPFGPIMPVNELNITYPFVPIGISNPSAPFLHVPQNSPFSVPHGQQEAIHRSSLRRGSYSVHRPEVSISLPTAAGFAAGDAYVDSTRIGMAKKSAPESDFSIDSRSLTQNKDRSPAMSTFPSIRQIRPRSISGPYRENRDQKNSSGKLRSFAKSHPGILHSIKSPSEPSKANQVILPKFQAYGADLQMPTSFRARSQLSPNEKISLCCRKKAVNPACQEMCNFDVLSEKTIVSAFLTSACPGPQLGHAFECASSRVDHSACCEKAGLLSYQGGRCIPFCRAHLSQPANPLEFLPCLQVFEHIKFCYRQYQSNHPNILGD